MSVGGFRRTDPTNWIDLIKLLQDFLLCLKYIMLVLTLGHRANSKVIQCLAKTSIFHGNSNPVMGWFSSLEAILCQSSAKTQFIHVLITSQIHSSGFLLFVYYYVIHRKILVFRRNFNCILTYSDTNPVSVLFEYLNQSQEIDLKIIRAIARYLEALGQNIIVGPPYYTEAGGRGFENMGALNVIWAYL